MSDDKVTDVLTTLYSDSGARASAQSERQYSVAINIVTLHVVALAGLIANPEKISVAHKYLAALAFLNFDLLACWYIHQKAKAYWSYVAIQREVEVRLRSIAGLTSSATTLDTSTPVRAGFKGSLAFIIAIAMSYTVILAALIAG